MTIRERTPADLPGCVVALREVYEASNYPTRWPGDPAGWLDPDRLLHAWVAEHEGLLVAHVGMLSGSGEPGLAAATGLPAERLALVTRLYVAPAGRGLGLARALVAAVVDRADALGLNLGLDVIETSHAAIALYESLGWRFQARARARWTTQDGNHPIVRYYLAPAE